MHYFYLNSFGTFVYMRYICIVKQRQSPFDLLTIQTLSRRKRTHNIVINQFKPLEG